MFLSSTSKGFKKWIKNKETGGNWTSKRWSHLRRTSNKLRSGLKQLTSCFLSQLQPSSQESSQLLEESETHQETSRPFATRSSMNPATRRQVSWRISWLTWPSSEETTWAQWSWRRQAQQTKTSTKTTCCNLRTNWSTTLLRSNCQMQTTLPWEELVTEWRSS